MPGFNENVENMPKKPSDELEGDEDKQESTPEELNELDSEVEEIADRLDGILKGEVEIDQQDLSELIEKVEKWLNKSIEIAGYGAVVAGVALMLISIQEMKTEIIDTTGYKLSGGSSSSTLGIAIVMNSKNISEYLAPPIAKVISKAREAYQALRGTLDAVN